MRERARRRLTSRPGSRHESRTDVPPPPPLAPARPAFTLIELVVVVIVIGILAGIAVPRFYGSYQNRRVEAAAYRVRRDLVLAQRQARTASADRTVSFDVDAESYTIAGVAHLDRAGTDYEVQLDGPPYEVQIIAVDLDGDDEVTFDGFGMPDSGGTIVVGTLDDQQTITLGDQGEEPSIARTVPVPAE